MTDLLALQDDGSWTLTLTQGDSADLIITVDDGATVPALVSLDTSTEGLPDFPAIVRFSIKDAPADEDNAAALTYRTSYDPTAVQLLAQAGPTLGQFTIHLDKPDTETAAPATSYKWDVEVSRQGELRTALGTVTVPVGGGTVTGVGTAFLSARAGDILQVAGGEPCLILSVTDASTLIVENPQHPAAAGVAFTIRRGLHRTVAAGACVILQGVVSR